jgi:hypothetical protein
MVVGVVHGGGQLMASDEMDRNSTSPVYQMELVVA